MNHHWPIVLTDRRSVQWKIEWKKRVFWCCCCCFLVGGGSFLMLYAFSMCCWIIAIIKNQVQFVNLLLVVLFCTEKLTVFDKRKHSTKIKQHLYSVYNFFSVEQKKTTKNNFHCCRIIIFFKAHSYYNSTRWQQIHVSWNRAHVNGPSYYHGNVSHIIS